MPLGQETCFICNIINKYTIVSVDVAEMATGDDGHMMVTVIFGNSSHCFCLTFSFPLVLSCFYRLRLAHFPYEL